MGDNDSSESKLAAHGVNYPTLSFVVVQDPNDAASRSKQRRVIRSHVAHHQHYLESRERGMQPSDKQKKRKRRRYRFPQLSFIINPDQEPGATEELDDDAPDDDNGPDDRTLIKRLQDSVDAAVFPIPWLLGGGRVDPFRTYPIPWEPYLPIMVDHYLVSLAVDIPELDLPGNHGLLRTQWFPLTMTEPSTFYVIMLIAASHYASVTSSRENVPQLLRLKAKAISCINSALLDPSRSNNDQLIGAVAKMASYEAMFGDLNTYKVHMKGLLKMVKMRGGLTTLGLNGLLTRICLWIDRNAAFVHNMPVFFTDDMEGTDQLSLAPNPGHFLGAS